MANNWKLITNINGKSGQDGKPGLSIVGSPGRDGLNGKDGTVIFKSINKPIDSVGRNGDWVFTELNEIYYKENNEWKFFKALGGGGSLYNKAARINIDVTSTTLVGKNVQDLLNRFYDNNESQKPTYNANGSINYLEFFQSSSQIESNRSAKIDMTYDSSGNPLTEIHRLYDLSDGTTILKTITKTYTWTDGVLTNKTQVVS